MPDSRPVILVPWRPGDPQRDSTWPIARRWLEELHWPLYTGDSTGDWNRSEAINQAAREAGDWDVAVISDADTIQAAEELSFAADVALESGSAVIPFDVRWKLNAEATERVGREGLDGFHRAYDLDKVDPTRHTGVKPIRRGGTVVCSREAWDALGGFDEGFRGWGFEEQAFRTAVDRLIGLKDTPGTCWHLWHSLEERFANSSGTPNQRRFLRYQLAKTPQEMTRLLADLQPIKETR